MKKTILILTTFLIVLGNCIAQSATENKKFMSAMEGNIKTMDTASNASTYTTLANIFERIANAEKKYWQPWYYAALCYGFMSVNVPDKNMIDPLTDKALEYLEKAAMLSKNNSEIAALKAMVLNTKILVDPVNRFQQYSMESAVLLKSSKEQDPTNPRPYLIEARTKLYTPLAFGGGPEAARPLAEKALSNFTAFRPENSIAPLWGLLPTQQLISKINGK